MKKLLLSLLLAVSGLVAAPALAQPGFSPGLNVLEQNPFPVKPMCWTGSAWVTCGTGGTGTPVTDVNNNSYLFKPPVTADNPNPVSEGSSAASKDFSTDTFVNVAGQTIRYIDIARGFYAICPAASTFVPVDVNGGSPGAPFPLSAGLQYHPMRIKSFSGNTGGCYIGLLF